MFSKANRRRLLQLRSKVSPINCLRLFWVLAVFWWEYMTFVWNTAWCRWPKQTGSTTFHVLLVADPQVPRPAKGWVPTLAWLKHHVVNHNLRKSWNAAKVTKPQAVVFLGDMLRHGSKAADMAEYGEYANRFKSIFHIKDSVPRYFVPGNHDVGLGSDRAISARLRDRFESHFQPTNQMVLAGGHTLVLLDAPALVEEDYRRHGAGHKFDEWLGVPGGSIGFLKSLEKSPPSTPVVLFSHIPLWRPDGASCGPLREFGNIRRGVRQGYQSMLGKETSRFVLDSVAPSVVFSADDHDYCDYPHPRHDEKNHTVSVREVTVKSFSMATKVRQPGFQLLSLFTPQEGNSHPYPSSYADSICLLPNQSSIYTHGYLPFFVFTIAILLILNLHRPKLPKQLPPTSLGNHEQYSPGLSPTVPSPPASPIQYKSSRSHAPGLRNASTLSPYPSQPGTPLGGGPFLSSTWGNPVPADDDDVQELLIWEKQDASVKLSPYIADESPKIDSSYFLPSPLANVHDFPTKAVWLSTFASGARLTSRRCAFPKRILTYGRIILCAGRKRARTWHGRFLQDIMQVALFPVCLYILIVFWSSF